MLTFDSIAAAREAALTFRFTKLDQLPDQVAKDRLTAAVASPSPVDQLVNSMEIMYANRDALDDDAKDLVAGLAAFCTQFGWHGLELEQRGQRITLAMARDRKDKPLPGFKFPKREDDPAPLQQYAGEAGVGPAPVAEKPGANA